MKTCEQVAADVLARRDVYLKERERKLKEAKKFAAVSLALAATVAVTILLAHTGKKLPASHYAADITQAAPTETGVDAAGATNAAPTEANPTAASVTAASPTAVSPEEIDDYEFCPADEEILKLIKKKRPAD